MPRLSSRVLKDVKRYINLRYDHKGEKWIEHRTRQVIKALKKESEAVQKEYSIKVSEFFDINRQVLEDAEKAKAELSDPVINQMLNMEKKDIIGLTVKHGGNVNAVMEAIRGNNNKQH